MSMALRGKIVGQERNELPPFSRLTLMRRSGIGSLRVALADELHLVIGNDLEAICLALA